MFKAALETFEIDRRSSTDCQSSASAFRHRISNAMRTLRRVVSVGSNVISNGSNSKNMVSAVECYQQQKARHARHKELNDFYFADYGGRQRISPRAWRRHSAFLFYQHQVQKADNGQDRKTA
ncbi:MAG: hypothetical protein PVJ39_20175 [Gammaproteobacteria bacterium]|jgi:hypothetical protein